MKNCHIPSQPSVRKALQPANVIPLLQRHVPTPLQAAATLGTLEVRDQTIGTDSKTTLKATETRIGKGSTGGVVNRVSKQPFLMDQHEIDTTLGTGRELRLTGDFNIKTGDDAALRINAMAQNAATRARRTTSAASRPPTAGASA